MTHGMCPLQNLPLRHVVPLFVMHAGIWKQVYGDDGKVTDIYFYRQLSNDELHTKVRTHQHKNRLDPVIAQFML